MRRSTLAHALGIWGPVVLYVGMIFYLSSQSKIPWAARYPDWIEHPVEYAGLAVLMARALNDGLRRPFRPGLILRAFLLCVACGIADECWQWFTPDRMSDVRDVINDSIGSGLALVALVLGRRLLAGRRVA